MKAESLEEDEHGQLLGDECGAGAAGDDLLAHAVDEPVEVLRFCVAADVDYGGKLVEEELGVAAGEEEVAADAEGFSAAVDGGYAAAEGEIEEGYGVDGGEGEVVGDGDGESAREEDTVAGLHGDWFWFAFDDEPARAGDDGVDFDAFVSAEAHGPFAGEVEGAGHVAVGLEEGEDFGERVG